MTPVVPKNTLMSKIASVSRDTNIEEHRLWSTNGPSGLEYFKVGFKFEGRSWYLVDKVDSIGLVGDIDSFGT